MKLFWKKGKKKDFVATQTRPASQPWGICVMPCFPGSSQHMDPCVFEFGSVGMPFPFSHAYAHTHFSFFLLPLGIWTHKLLSCQIMCHTWQWYMVSYSRNSKKLLMVEIKTSGANCRHMLQYGQNQKKKKRKIWDNVGASLESSCFIFSKETWFSDKDNVKQKVGFLGGDKQ